MKLTVTNEERAGLATWLIPIAWQGSEELMQQLASVFDTFALKEYQACFKPNGAMGFEAEHVSGAEREVELTEGVAKTILLHFPPQSTLGPLGRAKASLLGKLRALVPKDNAAA